MSETRREDEVSRVGTRKYFGRKFAARGGMQDGAKKHEVAAQHNWLESIYLIYRCECSYGYQDISICIRKMMYRIAVKEPPGM